MGVFKPLELVWKGEVHTVKPHRVMGLLSRIEETITFGELHAYHLRQAIPVAKISKAYASALQYAGARVTEEEIFEYAFANAEGMAAVVHALGELMKIMLPPALWADPDAAPAAPEPAAAPTMEGREPANPPARIRPLSRKRSRQRWSRPNG